MRGTIKYYERIYAKIPLQLYDIVYETKKSMRYNWSIVFDFLLNRVLEINDMQYGYEMQYPKGKVKVISIPLESTVYLKWLRFSAPFKNQTFALDYLFKKNKELSATSPIQNQ